MRLVFGFVALVAAAAVNSRGASLAIPPDFQLNVRVAPGGGPGMFDQPLEKIPKPWRLQIKADGAARLTILHWVIRRRALDSQRKDRSLRISPANIATLVRAINKSHFFDLPEDIAYDVMEHAGGASLRVTLNGRTREVAIASHAMRYDEISRLRIAQIWRSIVGIVPSPNGRFELEWFAFR